VLEPVRRLADHESVRTEKGLVDEVDAPAGQRLRRKLADWRVAAAGSAATTSSAAGSGPVAIASGVGSTAGASASAR
jgi:hypothetical protein